MIRYLTSGESHGPALIATVEGIPAGIKLDVAQITLDLRRRQMGYGRGRRMRIEKDTALILAGIWRGETIGSPISILIQNRDWKNWRTKKHVQQLVPRPGHADLPGLLKYDFDGIQEVIERASARETAARTAAGSVAKQYLNSFGIRVFSHTRRIGTVSYDKPVKFNVAMFKTVESSPVRCADAEVAKEMVAEIDRAVDAKDTLGGVSEVIVTGVPVGLGSYAQWDRRADARLSGAVMGIQSVKAIEIGNSIAAASMHGSKVHDQIHHTKKNGFQQQSNNSGGVIGGITSGDEIVVRAYFKPISTLGEPLQSVNVKSKKSQKAPVVRSDICIVPAGGVVCEAAVALTLADMMAEKFGGDSIHESLVNYRAYIKHVKSR